MKVRKIKTNKKRLLQRMDILVLVVCIAIASVRLALEDHTNFIEMAMLNFRVFQDINLAVAIFFFPYIFIMNTITKSFWILILYIPYRIARGKVIKENRRYEVIDNIEYYREQFKNISPAEISLIADLEMESKKDISATVLRLYTKEYIDFEEQKIKVIKTDETEKLKKSEQALLFHLQEGSLNNFEVENWKRTCIKEAINDGYIKLRTNKKTKHFWGSTILLIVAILFIMQSIAFFSSKEIETYIAMVEDASMQEMQAKKEIIQNAGLEDIDNEQAVQQFLEEDPEATKLLWETVINLFDKPEIKVILIEMIGVVFSILLIILIPIYKIIRRITYVAVEKNNQYERTGTGKILAEQIAAMQRYIHEFSLLSDKEKESIKLWEDFLVYAVVLEENEKIIEDVFSYKNVKMPKFLL